MLLQRSLRRFERASTPLAVLRSFAVIAALVCAGVTFAFDQFTQMFRYEEKLYPRVSKPGVEPSYVEPFCGCLYWERFEAIDERPLPRSVCIAALLATLFALICLVRARIRPPIERERVETRVPYAPRAPIEVRVKPSGPERARRIEARYATGFAWLSVAMLAMIFAASEYLKPLYSCCGRSCDFPNLFPNVPVVIAMWTALSLGFLALAATIECVGRQIRRRARSDGDGAGT